MVSFSPFSLLTFPDRGVVHNLVGVPRPRERTDGLSLVAASPWSFVDAPDSRCRPLRRAGIAERHERDSRLSHACAALHHSPGESPLRRKQGDHRNRRYPTRRPQGLDGRRDRPRRGNGPCPSNARTVQRGEANRRLRTDDPATLEPGGVDGQIILWRASHFGDARPSRSWMANESNRDGPRLWELRSIPKVLDPDDGQGYPADSCLVATKKERDDDRCHERCRNVGFGAEFRWCLPIAVLKTLLRLPIIKVEEVDVKEDGNSHDRSFSRRSEPGSLGRARRNRESRHFVLRDNLFP
jgi:hypothetical protein